MVVVASNQDDDHKTVERAVFDQIHSAIIERRLEPGAKLGEEALCEIYGISRAQIRRVLVDLSHSKVVELRRNRGAYVAQPSVREARHVFEARRAIEAVIVERAIGRVTASNLKRLHSIVEDDRKALKRGDSEASIKLSGDFHLYLAVIAGNQILTDFLKELISRTSLIIASYGQNEASNCSVEEHSNLIEELKRGDTRAATVLMDQHLVHIESLLQLTTEEYVSPRDLKSALLKT